MSEKVIEDIPDSALRKLINLKDYKATSEGLSMTVNEDNFEYLLEIKGLSKTSGNLEKPGFSEGRRNESNMQEKPKGRTDNAAVKERKNRTKEITKKRKPSDPAEYQMIHSERKKYHENLEIGAKTAVKLRRSIKPDKRKTQEGKETDTFVSRKAKNITKPNLPQPRIKASVNIENVQTVSTDESSKEDANTSLPRSIAFNIQSSKHGISKALTHNLNSSSSSEENYISNTGSMSKIQKELPSSNNAENSIIKQKSHHISHTRNKNYNQHSSPRIKASSKTCKNIENQANSNDGTNKSEQDYLSFLRKYGLDPELVLQHVNSKEFLEHWWEAGPYARLVFYHEKKNGSDHCSLLILRDTAQSM